MLLAGVQRVMTQGNSHDLPLQARQRSWAIGGTLQKMTLPASSALQIDRRGFMRLSIAAALAMGGDIVWGESIPMKQQ